MISSTLPPRQSASLQVLLRSWHGLVLLTILLVCSQRSSMAQPRVNEAPPTQFDRATVQYLLETIDKPRHASWIKVLYFSHRKPSPLELPTSEGWQLLLKASNAETPGTRRWFLLKSVEGAVAYREGAADPSLGALAYNALFEKAKEAPAVGAEYIVRAAINEFLTSLQGVIADRGQFYSQGTSQGIKNAWSAYVISRTFTDKFSQNVEPIDWVETFGDITPPLDFLLTLDQQVKDTPKPFYDLLSLDAFLHSQSEPEEAAELMERARPLLPRSANGKIRKEAAALYFERLIGYYKAAKQDSKIPLAEKDRVTVLAGTE